MMTIRCDQLFTYCKEEYVVLEVALKDGNPCIYMVNGSGELVYSCDDAVASDENQYQLKMMLNSFPAIVVYDVERLKKNGVTATFFKQYQPLICDVAQELAAIVGTLDIKTGKWLVRDLEEALSFYRYDKSTEAPIERAGAILWLADQVSDSNTTELIIKREQKLKDFSRMRGCFLQAEGM